MRADEMRLLASLRKLAAHTPPDKRPADSRTAEVFDALVELLVWFPRRLVFKTEASQTVLEPLIRCFGEAGATPQQRAEAMLEGVVGAVARSERETWRRLLLTQESAKSRVGAGKNFSAARNKRVHELAQHLVSAHGQLAGGSEAVPLARPIAEQIQTGHVAPTSRVQATITVTCSINVKTSGPQYAVALEGDDLDSWYLGVLRAKDGAEEAPRTDVIVDSEDYLYTTPDSPNWELTPADQIRDFERMVSRVYHLSASRFIWLLVAAGIQYMSDYYRNPEAVRLLILRVLRQEWLHTPSSDHYDVDVMFPELAYFVMYIPAEDLLDMRRTLKADGQDQSPDGSTVTRTLDDDAFVDQYLDCARFLSKKLLIERALPGALAEWVVMGTEHADPAEFLNPSYWRIGPH